MEKIAFSHFKKRLFANSALISLRYGIVAVIGLGVSLAFARLAPKEIFGQYQFILSLFSFFAVFSLPGLNTAALKSVSQGESGAVSQAVKLSFLGSLLAVPLLVGYGVYILWSGDSPAVLGWACIIFGIFFPLLNAPNTWYAYYEGRLRFLPVTVRIIISSVLSALLLLIGLWYQVGILTLVGIWFSTSILFSWLFYLEVFLQEKNDHVHRGNLDISYGLRVSLQKFVTGLTENVPILAISFFLGFEAVANFQVASVFVGAVSGLLGALTAMALPVFFANVHEKHSKLFFYSVLSGVIASIGYAILVETLFVFLYGAAYHESFELAKLLIPLPLLVAIRMYLVNISTARSENLYIISCYLGGNAIAAGIFWMCISSKLSFVTSAAIYLYALNLALLIALSYRYFSSTAFKKTDSI